MKTLNRLGRVFSNYGLAGFLYKLKAWAVDRWFDFRYNTDTCRWVSLEQLSTLGSNRDHGHRYEPARIVVLRRLFAQIHPLVPQSSVVVDFGSGKGRVLMVAGECGFRTAKGIEFSPELCKIARANCESYLRKTGIQASLHPIEGDVVDYLIDKDDNVLLFFNPFDDVVMRRVLQNLRLSLAQFPRKVIVCMYNVESVDSIMSDSEFQLLSSREQHGYTISIFTS